MNKMAKNPYRSTRISPVSTSPESSSSDELSNSPSIKTNPLKHKTELCKTFSELGYCNYGFLCRFAHGKNELVVLPPSKNCRKRRCKGFWQHGYCLYGFRCQFGHAEMEWENKACLMGLEAQCNEAFSSKCSSRLLEHLE